MAKKYEPMDHGDDVDKEVIDVVIRLGEYHANYLAYRAGLIPLSALLKSGNALRNEHDQCEDKIRLDFQKSAEAYCLSL